jgi:hypothetical protein
LSVPTAARVGGTERFVHDAADGAHAAPALGAAAEAAIDFTGGARRRLVARKRGTDVVVGQHIAGADDHSKSARRRVSTNRNYSVPRAEDDFNQNMLFVIILSY